MQFYFNADDRATYRYDYGARTDGQPDYMGKFENPPAGKTSAELEAMNCWQIHYFEYTTIGTDDFAISKKIATGVWNDRATLSYR